MEGGDELGEERVIGGLNCNHAGYSGRLLDLSTLMMYIMDFWEQWSLDTLAFCIAYHSDCIMMYVS